MDEGSLYEKMQEDLTSSAIRAAIRSRRLRLRIITRAIEELEAFQRIERTEGTLNRAERKTESNVDFPETERSSDASGKRHRISRFQLGNASPRA
jgi:hypothetical protein